MKNSKAKGPVRVGAVVPVLIVAALVFVYCKFFFDHNVRRALEYVGTHANGAEVDVGKLSTNFLAASLDIENVQVTDRNHPERNLLSLGQIRFQLRWDALLRAKILIDDAAVENIAALGARVLPGRVLPPAPPSTGPSLGEEAEHEVLDQTAKQYDGNFMGDLAKIVAGKDFRETLKEIEGQLKSEGKIKELSQSLTDKKAKWELRLKTLPQTAEFKTYEARFKALKFDFNDPATLAASVKQADQMRREIETKLKEIQSSAGDIKGEVDQLTSAIRDIPKMIGEDLRDLQARLKLPDLDAKNFSRQIFMRLLEKKLGSFAKYVTLARHYMPTKKPGAPAAQASLPVAKPARLAGRTYHFPVTTGYPRFWLKHAGFSSETEQGANAGHVRGDLRDVTSDPAYLGRPTVLTAEGEFPRAHLAGLKLKFSLDHTGTVARDEAHAEVREYPLSGVPLATTPDVQLSIPSALGSTELTATLMDQALNVDIKSTFREVKFALETPNAAVREILNGVLGGIPEVTLNATVTGSLSQFDVHINSNLGEKLATGFRRELEAKLNAAKAQLTQQLNARLSPERARLEAQLGQAAGPILKQLNLDSSAAGEAAAGTKPPTQNLRDEGKKLLKSFGF